MPIHYHDQHWARCWTRRPESAADIRCAILAAGLGRRLEPLTARYLPKPLFPLGGKVAMVETWVRKMIESGITDLSMNLCVLKQTIQDHFGEGAKFGAQIQYVVEETPSGTLGGVCKQVLGRAARVLPGESPPNHAPFEGSTIFAPSGDIVTNLGAEVLQELYDLHRRQGAAFTMALVPVPRERIKDFGTAVLQNPQRRPGPLSQYGRIVEFREKDPNSPSNLNNASVYLIENRLLRELDALRTEARLGQAEPFYDFGKHVFPALLGQLPHARLSKDSALLGVEYDGAWFDVGQKRDYLRVNEELLDGVLEMALPWEKLPWGYLGFNTQIDFSRVNIVPPVVIGNHCHIEAGVTLGPYAIIGDGWTIERNAQISRAVLWERYRMFRDDGTQVSHEAMSRLDPHVIAAGVKISGSIVAGGHVKSDVQDSTVEIRDDGEVIVRSIDYVPEGPRA